MREWSSRPSVQPTRKEPADATSRIGSNLGPIFPNGVERLHDVQRVVERHPGALVQADAQAAHRLDGLMAVPIASVGPHDGRPSHPRRNRDRRTDGSRDPAHAPISEARTDRGIWPRSDEQLPVGPYDRKSVGAVQGLVQRGPAGRPRHGGAVGEPRPKARANRRPTTARVTQQSRDAFVDTGGAHGHNALDRSDGPEEEHGQRDRVHAEIEERASAERGVEKAVGRIDVEAVAQFNRGGLDLPKGSSAHAVDQLDDRGHEAHPHRLHAKYALMASQSDDLARLGRVEHERLFAKQGFACINHHQRARSMVGVRSRDVHDVDVGVARKRLVTRVSAVHPKSIRECDGPRAFPRGYRHQPRPRRLGQSLRELPGNPARSDNPPSDRLAHRLSEWNRHASVTISSKVGLSARQPSARSAQLAEATNRGGSPGRRGP